MSCAACEVSAGLHVAVAACACLHIQGLLALAPAQYSADPVATGTALTRLWCHEVIREFGDRLNNDCDLAWLHQLVRQLLLGKFKWHEPADGSSTCLHDSAGAPAHGTGKGIPHNPQQVVSASLFEGNDQILFGDIGRIGIPRAERVYENLPSIAKLRQYVGSLSGGVQHMQGQGKQCGVGSSSLIC